MQTGTGTLCEFAAVGYAAAETLIDGSVSRRRGRMLCVIGAVRGFRCRSRCSVMMSKTMRMHRIAEDQPGRQQKHYCQWMPKHTPHSRRVCLRKYRGNTTPLSRVLTQLLEGCCLVLAKCPRRLQSACHFAGN